MKQISMTEFFRTFGRIGLLSFGGPAAQISLMQSELVDRHKWVARPDFLRALSFCMLLPGPEAMQLATFAGWRLKGLLGGFIAGLLFVLPGAAVILALAFLYLNYGSVGAIAHGFAGIQAAVIVIVIGALIKLSQKALNGPLDYALAAASFVAIFAIGLPFPLVILAAAVVGFITTRAGADQPPAPSAPVRMPWGTLVILALLWAAPMLVAHWAGNTFLTDVGLFFSKLAVVTFGGAYAVLSYMTQSMVQDFGWITTDQMVTALGLAETTPGPLILVTEFAAIVAGHENGGTGMALAAGAMALWVTFIPCFLWIFAGAPLLERLTAFAPIAGALSAITAAVVGVIFNLSLWFAIHVFFANVDGIEFGMNAVIPVPDITSANIAMIGIFICALWAKFWQGWSLFIVLGLSMVMAIVLGAVGFIG